MPTTVFYAWQSDRDEDICHYFIRYALDVAIKRIKAMNAATPQDATVEEAPAFPSDVELDHDTKGVAGTPKISDVIEKKIRECAIFVADVTHTTRYVTADGRKKKAQNGNVLIELGQALAHKPTDRILLVMNMAFGLKEQLPFDLHLYRQPIWYKLKDKSDKSLVAAEKKILTERLVIALKLMLQQITVRLVATTEAEARQDARAAWEGFASALVNGTFRKLEQRPYVSVGIIPLRPLAKRLDLSAIRFANNFSVPPPGTGNYNIDLYGRAIVCHNGSDARPIVRRSFQRLLLN